MGLPRLIPPDALRFRPAPGGVVSPHIAPLDDPAWVPFPEADHMRAEDPVIVTPAERSYVLPWWVMKNHHAANVMFEGKPAAVTLCERCSSAAAFDALVEGERRTFQVIGSWKGTHVVADHETESVWCSFTGECVWGVHHGARLKHLPLFQTAWGDCATLHPDSIVVDGAGESREGHGSKRWPGSPEPPLGPCEIDTRLAHNTLVLGVEAHSAARAYVLDELQASGGVIEDTVGGMDVVVFGGQSAYAAIAFERRLDGRELGFQRRAGRIEDRETGSTWALTGHAVSGPLAGQRLAYVISLVEEWYAWAAYHPATDIAGHEPRRTAEPPAAF